MKRCIVLSLGLLISFAANAADSCAVQSARLLSQGKVSDLAKMFANQGDAVSQSLERIAAEIGPVKKYCRRSMLQPENPPVRALRLRGYPQAMHLMAVGP